MQTFAPEGRDLHAGFESLDYKRLGKQRVEAYQIMRVLLTPKPTRGAWANHPAVLMWEDHICALADYGMLACEEWTRRGFEDRLFSFFRAVKEVLVSHNYSCAPPAFLDDIAVSHQSNLIRKDPEYYKSMWPGVPNSLPYVWPVRKEE